jgi:hypothetical protein
MDNCVSNGLVTEAEIYKQQSARFQNLNDTLYRIPPIFSTVIGGLWYFAASQSGHNMVLAEGILLFASAVGMAGGNALMQLRLAINGYLEQLNHFESGHAVSLKSVRPQANGRKLLLPRISTVRGLAYLLFLSSVLSLVAMIVIPFSGP